MAAAGTFMLAPICAYIPQVVCGPNAGTSAPSNGGQQIDAATVMSTLEGFGEALKRLEAEIEKLKKR